MTKHDVTSASHVERQTLRIERAPKRPKWLIYKWTNTQKQGQNKTPLRIKRQLGLRAWVNFHNLALTPKKKKTLPQCWYFLRGFYVKLYGSLTKIRRLTLKSTRYERITYNTRSYVSKDVVLTTLYWRISIKYRYVSTYLSCIGVILTKSNPKLTSFGFRILETLGVLCIQHSSSSIFLRYQHTTSTGKKKEASLSRSLMPYELRHGCDNKGAFALGTKHCQQRLCLCNMIILASETDDEWVRSNGHRLFPSIVQFSQA